MGLRAFGAVWNLGLSMFWSLGQTGLRTIGTKGPFEALGWPIGRVVFDSSDGRVVWSVCLLSCRLGFDSESGQTNDFIIGIHSFPA